MPHLWRDAPGKLRSGYRRDHEDDAGPDGGRRPEREPAGACGHAGECSLDRETCEQSSIAGLTRSQAVWDVQFVAGVTQSEDAPSSRGEVSCREDGRSQWWLPRLPVSARCPCSRSSPTTRMPPRSRCSPGGSCSRPRCWRLVSALRGPSSLRGAAERPAAFRDPRDHRLRCRVGVLLLRAEVRRCGRRRGAAVRVPSVRHACQLGVSRREGDRGSERRRYS